MGSMNRRAFLRLVVVSAGVLALRGATATRAPVPEAAPSPRPDAPPAPAPNAPPIAPGEGHAPAAPPRGPVSFVELPEKVVFVNGSGSWHVWKSLTWSPDGSRLVGPGYIGRLERPDGLAVVDDFREPGPLNDPRYGGLGAFGWQHARAGQGMWDVHGRLDAAANGGFGIARSFVLRGPELDPDGAGLLDVRVEFRDGWSDPIMAATYGYRFGESAVDCEILVEQLWADGGAGEPFVKEPKVVASVLQAVGSVDVLTGDGGVLRTIDLGRLPDPSRGTAQVDDEGRAGVRLLAPEPLQVAFDGTEFDRWAELAEGRARLSGSSPAYCLDSSGRLKRKWEIVKRRSEPATSCLFHAWEGGSGYPDCEAASRAFGPAGEAFILRLRYA